MSRSLCFNTTTEQICLQVTPVDVLQTQGGALSVPGSITNIIARIRALAERTTLTQQERNELENLTRSAFGVGLTDQQLVRSLLSSSQQQSALMESFVNI